MPLRTDPEDAAASLLCAADGAVLARFALGDDGDERAALRFTPVARPLAAVVAQARLDLPGHRLQTGDEQVAAAIIADGSALQRAATALRHDLVDVPAPAGL